MGCGSVDGCSKRESQAEVMVNTAAIGAGVVVMAATSGQGQW